MIHQTGNKVFSEVDSAQQLVSPVIIFLCIYYDGMMMISFKSPFTILILLSYTQPLCSWDTM